MGPPLASGSTPDHPAARGTQVIVTTQNYIGRLAREDLAGLPSAFSKIYRRAV
jgi:hypothetical protein